MRVLAWAGAPLPLFRPSRATSGAMRDGLVDRVADAGRARRATNARMHCHHEKTIVIDDRVAFVGGIDLTSEAGDRFDARHHPARAKVGWHDVATRIEGPAVADVAEQLQHALARGHRRAARAAGVAPAGRRCRAADRPHRAGADLQGAPRGDFGILESYIRALRSAERFIYLENQFLWSPEIAAVLADKIAHPPSDDFRILVLLPAKPNTGVDDTRGVLGELIEADADDGRLLACTIFARTGAQGRSDLRPRQGRDRRRRVADDRLGEPQRALALQRHRDEHRHPRSGARTATPAFGSGPSISSCR